MRRAVTRIAALVLAIVVGTSVIGVALAQDGAGEDQVQSLVPVLAVDAPRSTQVGEMTTVTVSDRETGTVVAGAYVYALTWPRLDLREADVFPATPGYHCESLGISEGDGKVTYAFSGMGQRLIVATKEGFGPGLAWLIVKPEILGRLRIDAPKRAEVGEPVIVAVSEKGSGAPVFEADVWAIELPCRLTPGRLIPSIAEVKGMLEGIREAAGADLTDVLGEHGLHLGQTDADGHVVHPFDEVGGYLLVATKTGYVPGVRTIAIVANKALAIDGARAADVDEDVTFTVSTRGTGDPVGGVSLYALSWGNLWPVTVPLPPLNAEGNPLTEALSALVVERGTLLGTTDGQGQLTNQFAEQGRYLIVGVEDGYVPGLTTIAIGQLDLPLRFLPQLKNLAERLQVLRWR